MILNLAWKLPWAERHGSNASRVLLFWFFTPCIWISLLFNSHMYNSGLEKMLFPVSTEFMFGYNILNNRNNIMI